MTKGILLLLAAELCFVLIDSFFIIRDSTLLDKLAKKGL